MARKKGVSAVVPALVLITAAAVAPPAGAAAGGPFRPAVAADRTDPPDAPGGDGGAGTDAGGNGDRRGNRANQGGANQGGANQGGDGQGGGGQNGGDGPGGNDQNGDGHNGQNGGDGQDGDQGAEQQVKEGPAADDFADIRRAPRKARPGRGGGGSAGSFTSRCGTNQNGHRNPDNFIVAPGVSNGAHHIHDYVGNLSADAFSTDESLAASGTTCAGGGDKSTYYWPVMRIRGQRDDSPQARESERDGNVGKVVAPASATMRFVGNAAAKVAAMPRFMRAITGDAKAGTAGTANARASWTCGGFAGRALADKYPLCPGRSRVTRVLEFPSCWDGRNTDSANHRDHVVFPEGSGRCPQGTTPVPRLRMTLTYDLPNRARAFAVDGFPEQGHDPVTDHGDFVNVMDDALMRRAVGCINSGRAC